MLSYFLQLDQNLFIAIHQGCQNTFFDFIMPFFRNPYFWAPVYFFLLVWMYYQFGKKGLLWCLFFFLTFVFADVISASFIKPLIQRIRPCHDIQLTAYLRTLVPCGSGFSFPSSHASNHFALSSFIHFTLGKKNKWISVLAYIWALGVCFAQLYVGVHYPSDILAGMLLGWLIAKMISLYFHNRVQLM
ncbi:MAG: phosphatase PAP2 family protein [Chitinophagaceae bacterium]